MGKEPEFAAVKFLKAPNRKDACILLRDIASKVITFTPRKVNKPLVLYGAGNLGKMAKEYFGRIGIPFLFVVDANPDLYKQDPFWVGTKIFGLDDVPIDQKESIMVAVCVALVPFSKLKLALLEQGWHDVVPFYDIAEAYRDHHPLSNGWHSGVMSEQDLFGIESVMYRWEDDVSRAHHLQFVAWRSMRQEWFFDDAPVNVTDRYFIPQVRSLLHEKEVFVDIGAHHGEVIIKFLDIVKYRWKEIYAIEPDERNFTKLRDILEKPNIIDSGKIQLLMIAIGSLRGSQLFFPRIGLCFPIE